MVGARPQMATAATSSPQNHPMGIKAQKLVRHGHQIELLQQAKTLCDQQDYVDLTIYCDDGVVRAHQMLLATASPFLKLLFQNSPLYGTDEISIILPEVKACLVQALVHFVYTGTVVTKEDHFYSLMKLVYALNINASIEAESTIQKPTTFPPALVSLETPKLKKLPHQLMQPQQTAPQYQQHQQPMAHQQQQYMTVSSQSLSNASMIPTSILSQQSPVVSLPTHPVPPAKMARLTNVAPISQPPSIIHSTASSHPQTHQKMAIQLPTQPVPISGMVNGAPQMLKQETSSYIAVDPTTGVSYKVEMPNGPVGSNDVSDPLAAIMNETIFTDSSGATIYAAGENGTLVYNTHASGQGTGQIVTSVSQPQGQIRVQSSSGAPVSVATTSAVTLGVSNGKGKKRKSGGTKENAILAESVDDLPCTPDDEDLNTPYPCEFCNKTIKGKVMLQAHNYQEHYENPQLANLELGDKHACRVCLKLFTRNSDVKAHILRVHCGDRRYPCTMCGKRFKESTHLRKHLYTHTGERPHFCALCNKGFQTSSDLKRHKRTKVHQEREEQAGGDIEGSEVPVDESKDEDAVIASDVDVRSSTSHQFGQWNDDNKHSLQQALATSTPQTTPSANPSGIVQNPQSDGSSTIDMKALGTQWNNNQPSPQVHPQQQEQKPQPNLTPGAIVAASSAATSASQIATSSTVDLKAISGSTVDVNALQWQQQQQVSTVASAVPQSLVAKREPSEDSPSQDEQRLTMAEGDDSSQESVQQRQQQMSKNPTSVS